MSKRDYYEVLGLAKSASDDEIKRAFRKAAMQWHPDRNPGNTAAEHKFKELNEAYEILSDAQKRAAYDQLGHAAFAQGAGPGGRGAGFDFSGGFADMFDDLFGEILGGGRRGGRQDRPGAARGADLRFNMEIALEDAYRGKKTQIRVPSMQPCESCEGSGAAEGAKPTTCHACRGAGRVRATQGFFTIERTCPACQGVGRVIDKPCRSCQGGGRVHREKALSVTIPPGVEDNTRIRLAGEGEAGVRGGPPGDLYIFLSLKPHRLFQREALNLLCRAPIPMTVAALGGAIEVPTLDGEGAKISIPAGTQTGKQFRLRGKGMPELRGNQTGDLFVEVMIETPVHLSKRQKELLEEFRQAESGKTNPETESFLARVKELWNDLKT
ncbi:MAG: molecular chaperone DnaJ [Alphaproteobacteria bacterium]|nr:molecular chaperone DnaJ [Alphaproteobacteria bacterium]